MVVLLVLFAAPAWAQNNSSGDLVGLPVAVSDQDSNGSIDLVRISNAQNCTIQDDATIVFGVANDPTGVTVAAVIDANNAQISSNTTTDIVRVRSDPLGKDIQFYTNDNPSGPTPEPQALDADDDLVVLSSSGIDCAGTPPIPPPPPSPSPSPPIPLPILSARLL